MKKVLVIILLIVAVPLYLYNALLLFKVKLPGSGTGQKGSVSAHTFERLLVAALPATFEVKDRDPFTLYKAPPQVPAAFAPKIEQKKEPVNVEAPKLSLSGILWNPDNPVAMVRLPDGATKLVKPGMVLDGQIRIKSIDKRSVTVTSSGRDFVIEKK